MFYTGGVTGSVGTTGTSIALSSSKEILPSPSLSPLLKAVASSSSVIFWPFALKAVLTSSLVMNPSVSVSADLKKSLTSYSVALAGITFIGSAGGVVGVSVEVSFLAGSVIFSAGGVTGSVVFYAGGGVAGSVGGATGTSIFLSSSSESF